MGLVVIGLSVLGYAYMSFGQSDAGWTTLIDGATGLDNWNRVGDANWRAEAGAIIADKGKGGFLVSKSSQLTVVLNGVQTANVQDSQHAQDRSRFSPATAQRRPAAPSSGKVQIKPL
jgi:hypothetical protein